MSRFLLGFETQPPSSNGESGDERSIILSASGTKANVKAEFQAIHDANQFRLPPAIDDLLAIATYCLEADKEMLRGTPNDIWLRDWRRELRVRASVSAPDVWNANEVRDSLEEYLGFLTGDRWQFEFVGGRQQFEAKTLFPGHWEQPTVNPDCALLFSGGLDSLACYFKEVEAGHNPILVSHTSTCVIAAAQQNLLKELQRLSPPMRPAHIAYCSTHHNSNSPGTHQESTQRTRGFLYAAMGLAVCIGHGLTRLVLADNGIISLNLATLQQSMLARNSRATHPKTLYLFGELAEKLTGRKIQVDNPLRFYTRKEVIEVVEKRGGPICVESTRSCSRQRGLTGSQPFCGTCSQCVDRRLGGILAKSKGDKAHHYFTDILKAPLSDYKDRMQVVSYVDWARKVNRLDEDQLFRELPDLNEVFALPNLNLPVDGPEYLKLLKRHAADIIGLFDRLVANAKLVSSSLPDNSLLRLVSGRRDIDARAEMIDELRSIFEANMRRGSNWGKWKNEKEAQQDVDVVLNAWGQGQFAAEAPQLPFAGISTKPDFSRELNEGYLYIEVKYPQNHRRYGETIKEVTSRFLAYQQQRACILFLVLDPKGVVKDREKLLKLADGQAGCWMSLIS